MCIHTYIYIYIQVLSGKNSLRGEGRISLTNGPQEDGYWEKDVLPSAKFGGGQGTEPLRLGEGIYPGLLSSMQIKP